MPTPAKLGRNRHKGLIVDARLEHDRLQAALGELVAEVERQAGLARPSLERVAVLLAQGMRATARLRRQLDEMHGLVAAAEPGADEVARLQGQIDELRERLEAMGRQG